MNASPPDLPTRWTIRAYAAGVAALGLISAGFQSLALQYQPVPPGLEPSPLAFVNAAVLLVAGLGLAISQASRYAAMGLTIWFGLWVFVAHGLSIPWPRLEVGHLLAGSELLVVTVGAAFLVRLSGAAGLVWRAAWLRLFGFSQVVFGLCHFVFLDITASMVPTLLPAPKFWAIVTGVAHLLAAVAFLVDRRVRLAAFLLSVMYGFFLLAVCVPLVIAQPDVHLHWLMSAITALHAASAWIVANAARDGRSGLSGEVPPAGAGSPPSASLSARSR